MTRNLLPTVMSAIDLPTGGSVVAHYKVSFQDMDARTVVSGSVRLSSSRAGASVSFDVSECDALTQEQATAKLADWLEGLAACLRQKNGNSVNIPL